MRARDLASYIFLAVAWGLSFLVLVKVVAAFGWVGAVTFRALLAGATLTVAARWLGRGVAFSLGWRPYAVVGASTVAAQLVGLSYGTPLIGTAMAAILIAAVPLFSMVISQIWGLERMTVRRLFGLVLGMGGIVLLVGFPAVPVTADFLIGCGACLIASFSAAYGSNYASLHLRAAGSIEVAAGSFLAGGLMTLPLLIAVPVPAPPALVDYLYLIIIACAMSALTYAIYFRLVASIGPTRAVSVEFAVTVVAVLVGAVLLREPLTVIQLVGAVIIIAGCMLVLDVFPARRARQGLPT
jgi:drug/metabolite transporter (DMT)-like permease